MPEINADDALKRYKLHHAWAPYRPLKWEIVWKQGYLDAMNQRDAYAYEKSTWQHEPYNEGYQWAKVEQYCVKHDKWFRHRCPECMNETMKGFY